YAAGKDVALAVDVAASEFYDKAARTYRLDGKAIPGEELVAWYAGLCDRYPIVSIEDGMAEDDWAGGRGLRGRGGARVRLGGDALFVTNVARLQRGLDEGIANAILVKVNQIGTLTETLDAVELAQRAGYRAVISHRSGETEDTFIADL